MFLLSVDANRETYNFELPLPFACVFQEGEIMHS